jgi:phage virion morphogenesis protein
MAIFNIKIDDREVLATLDKIIAKAKERRPLMKTISNIMWHAVEQNFQEEGRPTRWKKSKRAIKQGGKTLQMRSRLVTSFHPSSDNNTAMVGTNVVYAAIHQFGGTTKQAARMRIMHFDQRKSGRMTHGRPGKNVDHFAKPGKAKYGMATMGKAYSIKMPARPFIHLEPMDLRKILEEAKFFLTS